MSEHQPDFEEVESPAGKRERKAQERLERLLASGQKEASALNIEYDRLKSEAQAALERLARFEVEKLGMNKNETEE